MSAEREQLYELERRRHLRHNEFLLYAIKKEENPLNESLATAYSEYFRDAQMRVKQMAFVIQTQVKGNPDLTVDELVALADTAFNELSVAFGIISRYDPDRRTHAHQHFFIAENQIIEALIKWFIQHQALEHAFNYCQRISPENPAFYLRRYDVFLEAFNNARLANQGILASFIHALPWCFHQHLTHSELITFGENYQIDFDSLLLDVAGIRLPIGDLKSVTQQERITLLQYILLTQTGERFQPVGRSPDFFAQPIAITSLKQLNQQRDVINHLWLEIASEKKKAENASIWWFSDSLIQAQPNKASSFSLY